MAQETGGGSSCMSQQPVLNGRLTVTEDTPSCIYRPYSQSEDTWSVVKIDILNIKLSIRPYLRENIVIC